MKKLTRSSNKMIFGVLGGLGDYLGVDPTVLRLITVIISIPTGIFPGIIIYLLAALIIPDQSKRRTLD